MTRSVPPGPIPSTGDTGGKVGKPSCPNPPTAFIYPQRKPTQIVIIQPKNKIENKEFIMIVFHTLLMFSLKTVDKLLIEFEAISAARRCNIGVTPLICDTVAHQKYLMPGL